MDPNKKNLQFDYLIEVRSRLIRSLTFLFLIFAVSTYYANGLYNILAGPLLKFLPQGHLIATQIASPILVPFKLAFFFSVLIAFPYWIYQLWDFIAPALYKHERKQIWPAILISCILFYLGGCFAYFVIFPVLFGFITKIVPTGVVFSPDIHSYFDFATKMIIAFGGLFEIPILMLTIVALNLITREKLKKLRPYAIISAFILGMLLAPPDVFSQTLLAIPIWLLYEFGLFIVYLQQLNKNR